MERLTEDFVLKIFKKEGSYLSDAKDFAADKLCNETPKEIRDSILNGNHNDIEDTLKAIQEIEEAAKGILNK